MHVLTKGEILTNPDLEIVLVPVPEWGGAVYVRNMSADERDSYEVDCNKAKQSDGPLKIRSGMVSRCLCDENGKSLKFTSAEVEQLGKRNSKALDRVFERCQQLNYHEMMPEDLAKNSTPEPEPENDSGS